MTICWNVGQCAFFQFTKFVFSSCPLLLFCRYASQSRIQVWWRLLNFTEDARPHLKIWPISLSCAIECQLIEDTFLARIYIEHVWALGPPSDNANYEISDFRRVKMANCGDAKNNAAVWHLFGQPYAWLAGYKPIGLVSDVVFLYSKFGGFDG